MKKILVLQVLILISSTTFSQSFQRKNAGYIQFLGNGLVLSANQERQLFNTLGLNAQVGVGIGSNKPIFPIGLNYLFHLHNQKSFIETGFSVVLAEKDLLYNDFIFVTTEPTLQEYGTAFMPSIGYRYHATKGFMLKALYSPFFAKYNTLWAFYGIGIGWRF